MTSLALEIENLSRKSRESTTSNLESSNSVRQSLDVYMAEPSGKCGKAYFKMN